MLHFFITGSMAQARVCFEVHTVAQAGEITTRCTTIFVLDDQIFISMAHQDRRLLVHPGGYLVK